MSNERSPRRGVLLIVASPSGAGKTSLCRRLMADHGGLELSVSMTTRGIRPGEVHGRDYNFVGHDEFQRLIDEDAFLEWADVHGNRYGSPRGPVDKALAEGRDVLFDIDWQGAKQIADAASDDSVRVFILPPSWEDLSRRLHARAQDSEDVIQKRLIKGKDEVEHWRLYDYVIVNKNFDRAYADLGHIYRSERMKPGRNPWLPAFVQGLLKE